MKNIKTYSELNESFLFSKFDKIQNKIKTDLGINLYFSATFGTAITALFPFFAALVKTGEFENTINDNDVVLLVFCALSILLKENKSNIDKLKNAVSERGLTGLINKIIDAIKNTFKLFKNIGEKMGNTINALVDMFSYTALFVPFLIVLLDIINLYNIDFNEYSQVMTNPKGVVVSTSIGLLTITLKHVVNMLLKKITRKNKSKKTPSQINDVVQSFESVDIICENYFISSSDS